MFQKISSNLYALISETNSCNIFLLKGPNILIDTGLEKDKAYLEKSLKELDLTPNDISKVLFTHGHVDHIGGAVLFSNTEFWMSQHDGELVNKKDENFTVSKWFKQTYYPNIKNFYSKDQVFDLEDFSLKVIETPGHTKGSVCFYDEKNKILFSGDTLFENSIGRYDLPTSNKEELKDSIEKISKLDFNLLLPGHMSIVKENQKDNLIEARKLLE